MKGVLILSLLLFLPISLLAQAKTDQDIDVGISKCKEGNLLGIIQHSW